MTDTPSIVIHEVDLVQTEANSDENGTLYVDLTVDDRDVVRIYRDFPVFLYEEWMDSDFDENVYLAEIESVYSCVEEDE